VAKRYEINKNYFSKIDSEEKAYWLGFIAADGWITNEGKDAYRLGFNLQQEDESILVNFKESISSTHPIEYRTMKPRRKGDKSCKQAVLRIGCTAMCQDLISLGIGPRKTFNLSMPRIQEQFVRHFIRGYFDGDGSICKRSNANSWKFTIASGSEDIVYSFSSFFQKNNIPCSVYIDGKILCLTITKKESIIKIRELLYRNSNIHLERKHKAMMEVI
jgi:DNA-binding transcriptional regulator WhiA